MPTEKPNPPYRVRRSPIHGTGVFATRRIPRGRRVLEYVGERISHAEADRRYESKAHDDNHTFLFTVNNRTVIDGGTYGNEARWINHSCNPNCESVIDDNRVFIEAVRTIQPGDELSYDYMIERDPSDPPDIDVIFACRCGAPTCRGTMLLPPARKRKKKASASRAKSKAKAGSKPKAKSGAKTRTRRKATTQTRTGTPERARAGAKARRKGAGRR